MANPRRVLIIGGGPCGLVTLRNLLERGEFDDVQLVERRDNIGGVWYHSLDERRKVEERWPSPAYPAMIGNVIPEFLSFSGDPFPAPAREGQPFPTLRETYDYLARFARPLFERGRIRLHHEVVDVAEISAEEDGGWRVVMIDWSKGSGDGVRKEERWDAVVVTTVWYDNAYYPTVEGLDEIKQTGRVRHAQTWRGPSGYQGKRVVVVGNANSANDVAAQLAPVAQLPVYRATRRVSIFPSLPDDRIEDVGPVLRYSRNSANDKIAVHLEDRTIDDVDDVLFGTGYFPEVPYLRVLAPPSPSPNPNPNQSAVSLDAPNVPGPRLGRALVPLTGQHVQPARVPSLYRHILYAHNPSLAFIGALVSFIPFAMADLTSTWLALAWSARRSGSDSGYGKGGGGADDGDGALGQGIRLPPTAASRLEDERARLETLHQIRSRTTNPSSLASFHFLSSYELAYAQQARAEVVQAAPGLGDVLASWDEVQDARRFAMYATKLDSLYVLAGKAKE